MKNVTPAAGQVWESGNVNKIIDEVTPSRVFYNNEYWESYDGFVMDNTFIPQNDLEWLAVNVNGVDVRSFYAKDTSSRDGYKVNGKDLIRNYGGKLVQSKQIELGLDEPQQKETKMKAKIQKVELFNIEINGVTHKGFEKVESWKGLVCYKNKDGEIIANDFGDKTPFDWISFPSDGKAEPQEIIIVSASPCFIKEQQK